MLVAPIAATEYPPERPAMPNADPAHLAQVGAVRTILEQEMPDAFGGIWIEDDEATTTVATTASGLDRTTEIARTMLTLAPMRVIIVRFSARELRDTYDDLLEASRDGFRLGTVPLASLGLNLRENRVELVTNLSTSDSLEALRATLPSSVLVMVSDRPAEGRCGQSNCPDPLKAGLRGYRNGSFACMMGFIVQKSTKYYWGTAGHCADGTAGWRSPTETWQHPAGTNRGAVAYQGWYNYSMVDVALAEIPSLQRSNRLCRGNTTCSIRYITSRQSTSNGETLGQSICVQTQTGENCGSLHSFPYTVSVCKGSSADCRIITELRRGAISTDFGDSGGPVYFSQQAIGSVSANYPGSWHTLYSHVHALEIQAGVNVKVNSN